MITFNKGSFGYGGTTTLEVIYNNTPSPITIPMYNGYTFEGYYSSAGGAGTKYFNSTGTATRTWKYTQSLVTLYANWSSALVNKWVFMGLESSDPGTDIADHQNGIVTQAGAYAYAVDNYNPIYFAIGTTLNIYNYYDEHYIFEVRLG